MVSSMEKSEEPRGISMDQEVIHDGVKIVEGDGGSKAHTRRTLGEAGEMLGDNSSTGRDLVGGARNGGGLVGGALGTEVGGAQGVKACVPSGGGDLNALGNIGEGSNTVGNSRKHAGKIIF
ncbi:unnamed protein product [Ilex paraguariensis]|uniref:Uncharacterized protein n=1 Tax=Ilex paraguariensis TaxID=185542 RepID=A0ABC8RAM3_9AQUA